MERQLKISISQSLFDYLHESVRLDRASSIDDYIARIVSREKESHDWDIVRSRERIAAESTDE